MSKRQLTWRWKSKCLVNKCLLGHSGTRGEMCLCVCVCECACTLSHVQLFATPWTVACQVSWSMELSRQEFWNRLPFPSPRDLPDPEIELASLMSPSLAGRFFTSSSTWEALWNFNKQTLLCSSLSTHSSYYSYLW